MHTKCTKILKIKQECGCRTTKKRMLNIEIIKEKYRPPQEYNRSCDSSVREAFVFVRNVCIYQACLYETT
jgi:hypothetical protein